MDTGFFTFRNHTFQFAVFAQSQSNGDLIQFIFRKNYFQICNTAKHLDPAVLCSTLNIIIENSHDRIPPLRIRLYSVNISFRTLTVANQKNMLLIKSLFAECAQGHMDPQPDNNAEYNIDTVKYKCHFSGEMLLFGNKQYGNQQQFSQRVCLNNFTDFNPSSHNPLRRI